MSKVALRRTGRKNAEIFSIKNSDHYFLVIGRDPTSELEDYKNWGINAVACDVWIDACYPALKIGRYLYDYCDVTNDKIPYSIVTLFDPSGPTFQKLALHALRKKSCPMKRYLNQSATSNTLHPLP